MKSKRTVLAMSISLVAALIFSLSIINFPLNKASAQVPPTCVTPPADLISWWPGDGDATDIQDGNDGTLENGATFAAGMVDQGFSFDGVDDHVSIGNPANLQITGDLTLDAWIQLGTGTGVQAIVTKWGQSVATDSYGIWTINNGGTVQLLGAIGDGVTQDNGIIGGTITVGAFTHVAMTYDSANGTNTLYVNGVQVATRTRAGGIHNAGQNVLIGREDSILPRPFNGIVDEVEIFNRALADTEILALFNAGSAGKCKCLGIICPEDVVQDNDPGQCGAIVTFADPTPVGTGCGTITCDPPSGSFFPVGVTTVTCTAENGAPPPPPIGVSGGKGGSIGVGKGTEPRGTIACPPSTITGTLGSGSPDFPSVSGTQTGRLNRNGIASSCAVPKVCDIFVTDPGRAFDAYTFTNNSGATACVMVTLNVLTQAGANYQVNAYLGTYDPANICTNYLADPGLSSGIPPTPISMEFEVPDGADFVLVVHTTTPGEIGGDYELMFSGDPFCAAASGTTCSFTVTVNDVEPPVITCPDDIVAKTANLGDGCVSVNFNVTATDNCPGVTVQCVESNGGMVVTSGSCFPATTTCTTVTCTATDAAGNTAQCSFTVSVYDVCLEDDGNPSTRDLIWNSFTGDYIYCCQFGNNQIQLCGRGVVKRKGSVFTLTHNAPDRRVSGTANSSTRRGSASLQFPPGVDACGIQDRDITNNFFDCVPTCNNCAGPLAKTSKK